MSGFIVIILGGILSVAWWLIIISAVLSWLVAFNVINTRNPAIWRIIETLERMTYPILEPFRRVIPTLGGVDISPIFVLILIRGLQYLLYTVVAPNLAQLIG
ncbi:YggT family protein [Asticcacaulis sp. BYS171W]|uniref:YggT family protein n=1 Tax=Asticcacaulis aquaticus TaxID=2984212 RepID=A0ABT5HTL4_9CAUL|nr:YggT family protein [Asticcacaulis aquaticus]MDC7683288.1 YggT family protein [Asticcacaulis aquaticus]